MRFKVSTHLTILQNASQQNNNKELWTCSFNYLWEIKDLLNTQALLTTLQKKNENDRFDIALSCESGEILQFLENSIFNGPMTCILFSG